MDATKFENDYVTGQKNKNYNEVMARIDELNRLTLVSKEWKKDLHYGFHARECFDVCYAVGKAKAILVYLHAGYWQSRDKKQFYFIADHLAELGYHIALMNYPLCPEVNIEKIRTSLSYGLLTVKTYLNGPSKNLPMYICGHSAGAHLSTELILNTKEKVKDQLNIKGIIPISGIYDLEPLIPTSLNMNIKLNHIQARNNSPILRVSKDLVPAEFFVGNNETHAFIQQSKEMKDQWELKGNTANFTILKNSDHFSLLFHFLEDGEIVESIERLYCSTTA
ncbi:alpha/beta hydrolase [Acinetobacter johnsonii]|uniref:alpha/beta hydrolase n=1 Tax=Acinetobacter johnsonii TaxID=40214 RepID=UPI00244BC989|nr:alpha/beta hydrolase [Acinetobacter johnsonii]MDH1531852.1 alpha/beta hydrolase [Acinetobacter johnsonii]